MVSRNKRNAAASVAGALALSLQAGAAPGASRPAVAFSCPAAAPDALCAALETELARRAAPRPLQDAPAAHQGALSITLELTRQQDDLLEGRLLWQTPDGRNGESPLVEVVSADRPIDARALEGFARALLQVSDLPL